MLLYLFFPINSLFRYQKAFWSFENIYRVSKMMFYFAFLKPFFFRVHDSQIVFLIPFSLGLRSFRRIYVPIYPSINKGFSDQEDEWVERFFFRRMFNSNIKRKKQCNQTQFKTQQYSKKTNSTLILSFYLFEVLHFYRPNWMPLWYSCVPNKSAALNKSA